MRGFYGALTGLLLAFTQPVSAITITLDYTYDSLGFFTAAHKNVLADAAGFLEGRLSDSLTAINSQGPNHYNVSFFDPANTTTNVQISNYDVAADTLVVYVGGANLSGSTLAVGGPGGFGVSGTQNFVDNAKSRGQTNAFGTGATDFAPWGGAISFDTGTNWYLDADTSTTESFSGFDFFTVALHEMGHVLGMGGADSWSTWVSGSVFTGPESTAVNGGNVALHTDSSHWASGTQGLADGVLQDTIMSPSIAAGQRKLYTDLDLAALSDIGWEVTPYAVTPVPLPPALWLMASGMLGLLARARRHG